MADCPLVFFSFISLHNAGPDDHRRYNEWHQLDHRPENLALPGVAAGERWRRPPDCKEISTATAEQESVDYVAMYWFREPVERSVREWEQLGADSVQWGRGPMIPGVRRTLLAFFRPVKGYSAPSSLVSPAAIPYRPNQGLHLTLTRYHDPLGTDTHEQYRLDDQVVIPELLRLPGVAGAWTFTLDRHQDNAMGLRSQEASDTAGALRMRLLYLDDDPLVTTARVRDRTAEIRGSRTLPGLGEIVLDTPLRAINPWLDW
ncbi:hypothetical protein BST28_03220 [Mycolicibacter kumamotonensis]|uniref:Uncharacterized protein n=1 Tax=Mycolicibacter kumamotonensis TaxID=354243 RepID=A0A1X0EEI1_9MYCO|nr:hypothetical protein [Mycolicibacter kumamotonensis]ORA82698.1 hypothetical protein BST28_03220 [Mycolicibacter kumamotonensis]